MKASCIWCWNLEKNQISIFISYQINLKRMVMVINFNPCSQSNPCLEENYFFLLSVFLSLSRQGQGQSCYQWPSGQSKPRFQSKTEICSALHTQRLNDIFGPGIAHVPALGFRSGRCLGIHAQVFSQICWGKWPFLQNVCFFLIK